MDTNVKKAVGIIAVLSLLLGLSIGQLHRQHNHIKKLEERTFQNGIVVIKNAVKSLHHISQSESALREMEETRARLDIERGRVEMERARLHREIERLHRHGQRHKAHDFTHQKHIVIQE